MSLQDNKKIFTFKLYVFKNYKETEIRKFGLKEQELCYEKMDEILQAIFPNLSQKKYTLLWKDQINDMITLSTPKEFSIFEDHVNRLGVDEEIKLFINLEDELFGVSQKFEQNRLTFSCNTCQKRFIPKCLDCSRQNQLVHQEHKILNIVQSPPSNLSSLTSSEDNVSEENKITNRSCTSNETNSHNKAVDPSSKAFIHPAGFSFGSNFRGDSDIKKNGLFGTSPGTSGKNTNLFK